MITTSLKKRIAVLMLLMMLGTLLGCSGMGSDENTEIPDKLEEYINTINHSNDKHKINGTIMVSHYEYHLE